MVRLNTFVNISIAILIIKHSKMQFLTFHTYVRFYLLSMFWPVTHNKTVEDFSHLYRWHLKVNFYGDFMKLFFLIPTVKQFLERLWKFYEELGKACVHDFTYLSMTFEQMQHNHFFYRKS